MLDRIVVIEPPRRFIVDTVKMEWTKPQLIVLARGKPEESVLCSCKWSDYQHHSGPGTEHCKKYIEGCKAQANS
jgi:hypothetical protein